MDAHFENILTDGVLLYFSDFGLALSRYFDLSPPELAFIDTNITYDPCSSSVNLLHCIVTSFFGKAQWNSKLREYSNGKKNLLPGSMNGIAEPYVPIALVMDRFYRSIQKDKSTLYPSNTLEKMLDPKHLEA